MTLTNRFIKKTLFMKKLLFILGVLLISITHSTMASTPTWITMADIHFNPFIGCDQLKTPCPILNELQTSDPASWDQIFQKYRAQIKSRYYKDTNAFLLKSTFHELNSLIAHQQPAFILILGDFLAHRFPEQYTQYSGGKSKSDYQSCTKKIIQYLTYELNQAAPKISIYPALGNNDSYNGNYDIEPNGLFLHESADIFSTLIKDKDAVNKFKEEYPKAGYYAVTLSHQKLRLIVLNSVLFSGKYPTFAKQQAAEEQLTWLKEQLRAAEQQQQKVLLAFHIPPGIDVYLDSLMRFDIARALFHPLFWQTGFNKQFLSLLQSYSRTITGILPAHTHRDAFQVIANNTYTNFIPVSLTPSISPVYGNNPGLKVFSYDPKTFQLLNFDAYFCTLNKNQDMKWQHEYNFNAIYQPQCQPCLLINGMLHLKENSRLMDLYKKYYTVDRNVRGIGTLNLWCGIYHTDWESYHACVQR